MIDPRTDPVAEIELALAELTVPCPQGLSDRCFEDDTPPKEGEPHSTSCCCAGTGAVHRFPFRRDCICKLYRDKGDEAVNMLHWIAEVLGEPFCDGRNWVPHINLEKVLDAADALCEHQRAPVFTVLTLAGERGRYRELAVRALIQAVLEEPDCPSSHGRQYIARFVPPKAPKNQWTTELWRSRSSPNTRG